MSDEKNQIPFGNTDLGELIGFAVLIAAFGVMIWVAEKHRSPIRIWVSTDGKEIVVRRLGPVNPPIIATNSIPQNGAVGFEVEVPLRPPGE